MARLAVIFHRFGPYHLARLAAAARRADILAIEEAADTSEYGWETAEGETLAGLRRVTLLAHGERPRWPVREMTRRLHILLNSNRLDAVVIPGWSDPAALAALRWGLRNGVPAVIMSESTAWDEPRSRWKEGIKARIVKLCSAGLAGGEPHVTYLAALGLPRDRIFTGYDIVDNDHFAAGAQAARANPTATRARLNLPENYFLACSRFVPQKNLSALLTAYANYRRMAGTAAWKLVVLGDGPLRHTLTEQAASLGIAEDILLPGFKQYRDLPSYYGLANGFVHASTREPWGLVVNEAMAAGLPVIVSNRCGCAADLVADGENGYLFSPKDTAALTGLLSRVATAGVRALAGMSDSSQQRIATWSPAAFAENLCRAVDVATRHPQIGLGFLDSSLFTFLLRRSEKTARRLLPMTSGSS